MRCDNDPHDTLLAEDAAQTQSSDLAGHALQTEQIPQHGRAPEIKPGEESRFDETQRP